MSVTVAYSGGLGNNLFQYVSARLFAVENGLRLDTPIAPNGMVAATPHEPGESVPGPPTVLGEFHGILDRPYGRGRYDLRGYFQNANWILGRETAVRGFLRPLPMEEKNVQDIVIHCRLGDYAKLGWVIDPKWYLSVLERERFRRLYIVTDTFDRPYLSAFKPYDPHVLCSSPSSDWQFLRSFDRMVISLSTFAWWAAFLGDASRIYTFLGYPFGVDLHRLPKAVAVGGALLPRVPA